VFFTALTFYKNDFEWLMLTKLLKGKRAQKCLYFFHDITEPMSGFPEYYVATNKPETMFSWRIL